MRHLFQFVLVAVVVATAAASLSAQEPVQPASKIDPALDESLTAYSSHPEMWLYLQEQKQYNDPKVAVRRNAEIRGQQRQARLASMKWFGYSNSRPSASPTPTMGTYSPFWGGNTWNPYMWAGVGHGPSAVQVYVSPR